MNRASLALAAVPRWARIPPVTASKWLFGVLFGVLFALFVLLTTSFLTLKSTIDAVYNAASGSMAWVVAPLERDFSQYQLALLTSLRLAEQSGTAPDSTKVMTEFDIYYGRVDTVIAAMSNIGPNPELQVLLALLAKSKEVLASQIDALTALDASNLQRLLEETQKTEKLVSEVTLRALQNVVAHVMQKRADSTFLLWRSAGLVVLLLSLLLVAGGLLTWLWTQMKQRAQTQEQLADRMRQIINAALDGVIVADWEGRSLQMNPSALATFGYEASDLRALRITDLVGPLAGLSAAMARGSTALMTEPALPLTKDRSVVEARRANGDGFQAEVSVVADLDSNGVGLLVCFVRDISERVRADIALRQARDQAEKDARTKARFLAVMSHEMRTPLHGVIAALDLIAGADGTSERHRLLKIARECSQTALEQIDDVLELTRNEVGHEELTRYVPAAIAQQITEQIQPLAAERGNKIEVVVQGDATGLELIGQPHKYRRVLYNLVGNAVKFTSNGSVTIRVLAELQPDGGVKLQTEVQDSGIGIAPEDHDRIFLDFEMLDTSDRRAAQGTGLGLAIARRAVREMGGDITVSSQRGEGSVFAFSLLQRKASALAMAANAGSDQPGDATSLLSRNRAEALSMLVVDDNEVNLLLLAEMARRLGFDVDMAADGMTAISRANAKAYDLVLMDISMPGMDGIETTRRIRLNTRSARALIIAVSALVMPEDLPRLAEVGIDEVFLKPIGLETLSRRLNESLRKWQKPEAVSSPVDSLEDALSLMGRETVIRLAGAVLSDAEAATDLWQLAIVQGGASEPLVAALHRASGSAAVLGCASLAQALRDAEHHLRTDGDLPAAALLAKARTGTGHLITLLEQLRGLPPDPKCMTAACGPANRAARLYRVAFDRTQ